MPKFDTRVLVYATHPERVVRMEVTVGDAQQGGWTAFLDGAQVASDASPPPVELGLGADLVGKSLTLSAIVVDIRPETDRTSLTVALSGGLAPAQVQFTDLVDAGDSASYVCVVSFS